MGRYSTFCSTLAKQTDSGTWCSERARYLSVWGRFSLPKWQIIRAPIDAHAAAAAKHTADAFPCVYFGGDGRGNLLACVKCIERLSSANYTIYKHARWIMQFICQPLTCSASATSSHEIARPFISRVFWVYTQGRDGTIVLRRIFDCSIVWTIALCTLQIFWWDVVLIIIASNV